MTIAQLPEREPSIAALPEVQEIILNPDFTEQEKVDMLNSLDCIRGNFVMDVSVQIPSEEKGSVEGVEQDEASQTDVTLSGVEAPESRDWLFHVSLSKRIMISAPTRSEARMLLDDETLGAHCTNDNISNLGG